MSVRREIPRSSSLLELFGWTVQCAFLTVLVLPFHLLDRASVFDDAYIHLRIAHNLATLGQPFFNVADPVISTSAPLWTILIALLTTLPFDPRVLIGAANALASALATLAWTGLMRDMAPSSSAPTRFLLALGVIGLLCVSSAGLMETPLAIFFAGYGLRAALRGSLLSGAWITFGSFLRPEISVFVVPVAIVFWRFSWKRFTATGVVSALIAGAGLFVMHLLFGGIVPHSITAKHLVYQGSPALVFAGLLQSLCGEALPVPQLELTRIYVSGALALVVLAIFFWRTRNLGTHDHPLEGLWICMAAAGIAGAYAYAGALLFPWYAPLILVPLSVAVLVVVRATPALIRALFLLWLCAPGVWILTREYLAVFKNPRWAPLVLSNSRVEQFIKIGKVLDTYVPEARIAAPEIGALGYVFDGTILDSVGLATSSALQFHPLPWPAERISSLIGAVPGPFIALEHPEIVVGLHDFISTSALALLKESYTVTSIPMYPRVTAHALQNSRFESNDLWERQSIEVFIRNDVAPPPAMIDELESIR